MSNRFLAYAASVPETRHHAPRLSQVQSLARTFTASQRALVVLIENGGIDLDLAGLIDKFLGALPGGDLITAEMRRSLATSLREKIKTVTDTLIESAELALNRYASAAPQHYDSVAVLRDGTATYEELKRKLIELSKAGKMIDLMILTHGGEDTISLVNDIDGAKIKAMKAEHGRALNLRSVYMMNCIGSSLNDAWIAAGAKVSSGSIRNNYLPEPTTHFFWENWKAGQSFETAATGAYRRTIALMNDTLRGFVAALPFPGSSLLAKKIDVETMQFVIDSAPVVQGQRSVAIASDDLVFGQSLASSLATTVVPISLLRGLASGGLSRDLSRDGEWATTSSYLYENPAGLTGDPNLSRQQVAPLIAGIAVADAIQIGLAGVAVGQTALSSVSGDFALSWDSASRLLTSEARQQMPGAQRDKQKYRAQLLRIAHWKPGLADATVVIEWEGNAFGEIGAVFLSKDLDQSSDWSKSSCNITFRKLDSIPPSGVDPREWPVVYRYTGNYDPVFNGKWEFEGEFEINAFGSIAFKKHKVVTRAMIEFTLKEKDPYFYVKKGADVKNPVPTIPDEQVKYLKSRPLP